MPWKRRRFTAEFKSRVVRGALKEDKTLGLEAVYPRRRKNTSHMSVEHRKYPYLLRHGGGSGVVRGHHVHSAASGRCVPCGGHGLVYSMRAGVGVEQYAGLDVLRGGVAACIGERSPLGLPPQQQREHYPWRRFHLIPGWKLPIAWGQANFQLRSFAS